MFVFEEVATGFGGAGAAKVFGQDFEALPPKFRYAVVLFGAAA